MSRLVILLSAILVVLATIIQQAKAAAVPSASASAVDVSSDCVEETDASEESESLQELDAFQASALPSKDIKDILNYHNQYRAKHHAPSLKWNETLATYAQNWSNGCEFKHSHGLYGENLGYGHNSWKQLVDDWYNEVNDYSYLLPGFSAATGHFTQLVWKSTTSVGCGVQTCDNLFKGAKLYTCSYSPHGNVIGINFRNGKPYFGENVLAP